MMKPHTGYKSPSAQERALISYNHALSQWPVPHENKMLRTTFGETYMVISGKENAQPLILLHGGGGNSSMWTYNIAALAQHFRVYAIDIIGEAGKSAGYRPSCKSGDYACWLNEVLNALHIEKAAICGASSGGTIAHMFVLQYPESVTSLVLLAPPSLFKMRLSFIFRFMLANIIPAPYFAKSFLNYMSSGAKNFPQSSIDAFVTQIQSYKLNMDQIPIITDQQLAQLPAKTLILIGEEEIIYDAHKVAERIKFAAPSINVVIIPNAKHTVSVDQPDVFSEKIINFCI